jgi:small subunit ribosomal protein S1
MEGTEEADTQAAEAQASETATAETEVPQTPADTTAAQTEAVDTAADTTANTADAVADTAESTADTAESTVDSTSDSAPELSAVDESAVAAEASLTADDTADAPAADDFAAEDGVDAEVAADDAVDLTDEAEAPAEPMQSGAPAAEGDSIDAVAAEADVSAEAVVAADADAEASPAASYEDAAPVVATAPKPRVYEGPEPTTMEELLNEQATEIRSLKHGDVVEGNVVRIDKDEILVDIGAKSEGVISNRELYGRNAESQPELSIGDVVLVYVLQPESPEGHAVLSLRRAGLERKWRSMQEQLDAGVIIEAPVIDHNKGGLIVDCGIRGFVPISQIVDFPRRPQNEQPRDAAQEIAEKLQPYVGRKLRLKILEVNRKANRLILSEKVALYEERREKRDELFSSLQVGQKVTGTVRSIAPFGVFIDLGGIDGLVHKSELSWNKVNNPEAGYRVGEEVEAEVIDINHERGRISLSIRRLQPDPWSSTVADLKVGDIIDGTVTKIVNFGAFVRVRDGLEGLIHISELSHQRVAHPGDVVHEGQTLKLKIISLEQDRHRLGLSLKQAEEAPARPERPAAPRERRARPERGYDMSQAVQEPEGGIDNTLAAAFAQVRQQIAETEAAREGTETEDAEDGGSDAADAEVTTAAEQEVAAEPEMTAEPELAAEPEAPEASAEAALATGTAEVESSAMADVETSATADAETSAKADAEAPAEEAAAEETAARAAAMEAATAEDVAPAEEAKAAPKRGKSSTKAAAASSEEDDKALPETGADPAEGADDAAPAEGADTDDSAQ